LKSLSYKKHAGEKKKASSKATVYGSMVGELEIRSKGLRNTVILPSESNVE
jgi:hypothetical protein